jgi:hypothetical protein
VSNGKRLACLASESPTGLERSRGLQPPCVIGWTCPEQLPRQGDGAPVLKVQLPGCVSLIKGNSLSFGLPQIPCTTGAGLPQSHESPKSLLLHFP